LHNGSALQQWIQGIPERQHERRAMTIRAWTAAVLDVRALTRSVLEHALEVVESGFRDFSTMKEKLLLWSNEATRGELTQKLVVDVALVVIGTRERVGQRSATQLMRRGAAR
jgi:hypothetical protein